ncbi:CpaF family protein [soil metagenome]
MIASELVDDLVVERVRSATGADIPSPAQLAELVRQIDPLLGASAVGEVVARVQARVTGLGPLEGLLGDPEVSDVLVNGPGPVWVERAGAIERTDVVLDRSTIDLLVERIVAPLGRRVDPASPVVDARLPDGSRVHVVVPPLAVDGPYLTIRRFATRRIDLADAASPEVARLLGWAVRARANVLVVGGTGSGKTTLLNALASVIAPTERIVTVEDAAELRLPSDHVVRLETRPASVEGVAAVDCRELVRNALRMRPDRLVIGEVRGGEALDLVQAMNTGHDGSLSTLHANSCEDAMRRLETLVLLAGVGLPLHAVREHLAAAVDLVVHIARSAGGGRRVVEVAEVCPVREAGPDARATRAIADAQAVHVQPQRSQRWAAAGPFPMAVPE